MQLVSIEWSFEVQNQQNTLKNKQKLCKRDTSGIKRKHITI
jgi:hypothetical protein